MTKKILIPIITFLLLASSLTSDKDQIIFTYPKNKAASFTMVSKIFSKFKKEWRGEDYYYISDSDNGFICSVLFYKLNKQECEMLVNKPAKAVNGPAVSPIYPLSYFMTSNKLKEFEENKQTWGTPSDEFMFRHAHINEFQGVKLEQKNMYAYTMFGNDIFVQVHMSKILCSTSDSVEMRNMLSSLKKK